MKLIDLKEYLSQRPYPGRGIVLGRTADNKAAVAYFIMGRSENSRNRIFERTEDGIRTRAFDESKMTDPSLIIYHPVRLLPNGLLAVTNGDQTDTIRDFLEKGLPFEQALRTREFEPDGPNWTSRISGLMAPDGSYKLSILKAADPAGSACDRYTFEYAGLPGTGHFISTYETDGSPLPAFHGEPRAVSFGDDTAADLARKVWTALNEDNKVSLFVRTVELQSGETDTAIINKHQEA